MEDFRGCELEMIPSKEERAKLKVKKYECMIQESFLYEEQLQGEGEFIKNLLSNV